MKIFTGRIEVDGEGGALKFYLAEREDPLITISGLPLPLPLLIETDSLLVGVKKAHCSFKTNTGSGREWWTK